MWTELIINKLERKNRHKIYHLMTDNRVIKKDFVKSPCYQTSLVIWFSNKKREM
jgi:hypothetical protein